MYAVRDDGGTPARAASTPPTAAVTRADMVDTTEVDGTLGYSGGYTVLGQGGGRLTWLPETGAVIERGERVYGRDGEKVPLFYGPTPFWRTLQSGMTDGRDVLELERNLDALGYNDHMTVDRDFTYATTTAIMAWQKDLGLDQTGTVGVGDVVMMRGAIRVEEVDAVLGDNAGGKVLTASSTERRITVDVPVADQNMIRDGAGVRVTLPGGATVEGKISSIGSVATAGDTDSQAQTGQGTANATIPVYIALDDENGEKLLDGAPVTVGFTGTEHKNVLAVPINALLASADGTYKVNVVDAAGKVTPVPVELGVFDGDRVEVSGDLKAGMKVQVPRS
ncbi:hypothetical protein BJF79_44345 [Actinomadura sp. CNU-125]|nr:hypothetical protein BJF79_44345 [Actinomadura sp. CNU-125]